VYAISARHRTATFLTVVVAPPADQDDEDPDPRGYDNAGNGAAATSSRTWYRQ
jgi:hypothetical protein